MVLGRPSLVRGSSSDKGHNFTNMITNLGIHHIGEIMSFFILSILRIKNGGDLGLLLQCQLKSPRLCYETSDERSEERLMNESLMTI